MKSKKLMHSLIFVGLSSATAAANAQITLDFTDFTSGAYYGKSNIEGGCTAAQSCYSSNGYTIGTINDPNYGGASAHLHQKITGPILDANGDETGLDDYAILHHNDSAGIYLRANDGSAFSFDSFYLNSAISTTNKEKQSSGVAPFPATGPNAFWEIIGFSIDYNADLNTYSWGSSSLTAGGVSSEPTNLINYDSYTVGAYQAVDNGFVGDVVLNDAFKNVNAIWIHYGNHPNTTGVPNGDQSKFEIYVDNFKISEPAPVPVPAAVYLFGTGLMGFLAIGKRRRSI